ncbi:hypothetical protein [Paenibacillus sp. WLX2291]|uniref:hypothetical protein n=1 Tax=Paenibacillus sp. WLX2291 TaxID=3296934 RepID=UPI0039842E26
MQTSIKTLKILISFVLLFNFILFPSLSNAQPSATNIKSEEYSNYIDKLYEQYEDNIPLEQSDYAIAELDDANVKPSIVGPIIGHIVRFTMQQLAQRATAAVVHTTARNVVTSVSIHAIREAINDGITTAMIDNLLDGKASGMRAVEKYVDIQTGARIVHDPNNKLIAVLSSDENQVITVYNDNGKNTIDHRVNITKRWFKSVWSFK